MQNANGRKWCVLGLMLALSATAVMAKQGRRVDNKALRNAVHNADEWLSYGHDYTSAHYSSLKQVNARNVSKLGLAWYYQTQDDPGTVEGSPIEANGTLYFTATWDELFAVNARTGQLKWKWIPKVSHRNFNPMNPKATDRIRIGPSVCCGPANRGVAIYDGKVYMGTLDGRLIAFDAATGKIVWQVQSAPMDQDYSITGAPLIANGMVIIGMAGGEYAVRGYATAYNAETGKQIWRAYTVPGNPSKPFEDPFLKRAAKTWTGSEWWKLGGGGAVWNAISYDPKLNLVYIGSGQGGPWVQKYRSPDGGANEWTDSVIALNANTGKYVWAYQTVPGDNWDYDTTEDMVLTNLKIDGKKQHVLMTAPKDGVFYVLNAKTGKFISCKPYVKVTWATSFNPKTGTPTINPNAIYGKTDPKLVWPGPAGGHAWYSMSYNPETKLAYIPAIKSTFLYAQAAEFKPEMGVYKWGITLRPLPKGTPRGSEALEAWNPVSESKVWSVEGYGGSWGGTMTTAGNLVFAASTTGEFSAFAANSGKKLWSAKVPPETANPITYSIDGKQYISVLAGRYGKSRLYTFVLGGTEPMPKVAPHPSRFGPPPQPHHGKK